ncbi:hypothetical protein JTB14_004179 [Gonioctena quinquepunctata]|nr:hypothetical protein JTB14_004179 [Gonioctena quinquepunctata]
MLGCRSSMRVETFGYANLLTPSVSMTLEENGYEIIRIQGEPAGDPKSSTIRVIRSGKSYDVICFGCSPGHSRVIWYHRSLGYWKRKGLNGPQPSFPFGNVKSVVFGQKTLGEQCRDIYFELKHRGMGHGGFYILGKPNYIPVNLKIVKAILHTDSDYFNGRGSYMNGKSDPLSLNVFNMEGERWKSINSRLSPTFTSAKVKTMMNTFVRHSQSLDRLLEKTTGEGPVRLKDIMRRFTTDVIGTCAYGIEIESMKNPNSELLKVGVKAMDGVYQRLKQVAIFFFPHRLLRFFSFSVFGSDMAMVMYQIVCDSINFRSENNDLRNDLIHQLYQPKKGKKNEEETVYKSLPIEEIAAHCFGLFLAGYEAASVTLDFTCYQLALNKDVQEKARQEINEVLSRHDGNITYEAIMEMSYLEKVIHEALRIHPALQFLYRKCMKNYIVPGTDVEIEKGTMVIIPVMGIHFDPEYYPDPEKFNPERFNEKNNHSRPNFAWLPFGEGARMCIGKRFGMAQTMIALITLLRSYAISLDKTTKVPLVYDTKGLSAAAVGGLWFNLQKL